MFTGIIAGLGKIANIQFLNNERRFAISPMFDMDNIIDGESIAINGVCLSVEKHHGSTFESYASMETVSRSNLGALRPGQTVNLERALELGQRMGGHIVTGHVDCLAVLKLVEPAGHSIKYRLAFPASHAPQVVAKGSVALDGISLTVNACGQDWLEVNIIPDSQKRTTVRQWRVGSEINMETDLIGKYVQHMLMPWREDLPKQTSGVSMDLLARYGFL